MSKDTPEKKQTGNREQRRAYGGKAAGEREEERRARLLQAAVDLFGTQGYAATTLQQICASARVAPRHFYEHFESREAILAAILEDLSQQVLTRITRCDVTETTDVRDYLQKKLAAVISFYEANPKLTRINCIEIIGVSEWLEQRRREKSRRFTQFIVDDLQILAERKLIPRRDYRLTAIAMVGAIDELLTESVLQPESTSIDAIVEEAVRLFVAAVS